MGTEIWKSVKDYEGYYEVSNLGRVKSLAREWITGERFGIRRKDDSILKLGYNKDGYLSVTFCVGKVKKIVRVARLVANHFVENINNYPVVNHLNSIRDDNRAVNLEWVTTKDNVIHSFKNGFRVSKKGEGHYKAKLKNEDILNIKKLYSTGNYSQYELASIYGMGQVNIGRIINGKRWPHIK